MIYILSLSHTCKHLTWILFPVIDPPRVWFPSQQVRVVAGRGSHSQTGEWQSGQSLAPAWQSTWKERLKQASTTSFSVASPKTWLKELHLRPTSWGVQGSLWGCGILSSEAGQYTTWLSVSALSLICFHLLISFREAVTAPPPTNKNNSSWQWWTAPEGRFTSHQKSLKRVRASHLHRPLWSPEDNSFFFFFIFFLKRRSLNLRPQMPQVTTNLPIDGVVSGLFLFFFTSDFSPVIPV